MNDDKKGSNDTDSKDLPIKTQNASESTSENHSEKTQPESNIENSSTSNLSSSPGQPAKVVTSKAQDDTAEQDNTADSAEPVESSDASEDKQPLFSAPPAPRMATRRRRSARRKVLPIAISLLLIIVIAGIIWVNYTQQQMQVNWQALQTQVTQNLEQQAETSRSSLQTANNGLAAAQSNQTTLNQQSQLVQQLREALGATQQRLKELSGRRQQDWLLAEAEYLIKLAEYKITLEKDRQSAVALLKTADEKIALIGDNELLELRQSIAQDIADLQLIIAPDVSGVAMQLNAMTQQIPALNLKALEFEPIAKRAEEPITSDESFSWSGLYENFLNDFVKTEVHSEARKPLITLEQRGNLNANIQVALQQAQIALVRGEQGLYDTHIANATLWVNEYFIGDELTAVVLDNLAELKHQRVVMDLPRALTAKQTIQAINQQRLYQWLEQPSSVPDIKSDAELESQP